MISDILSQAVVDLDDYLKNPNFDDTYNGQLRERIIRLRDEAEYIEPYWTRTLATRRHQRPSSASG